MRQLTAAVASGALLTLSGCALGAGVSSVDAEEAGPLRPSFSASADRSATGARPSGSPSTPAAGEGGSKVRTGDSAVAGSVGSEVTPTQPSSQVRDARVLVVDPSGDVAGGFVGSPGHVDMLSADLRRVAGRYTLVVGFAGPLPERIGPDEQTENVALFADVDGDGQVDFEVMGSLADDGWSGAWRYPSGAKFGAASEVSVVAEGRDLVLRFGDDRVGRAGSFRWAVAAEWGTYTQVASGTTARDYTPDEGATSFPG